MSKNEKDVVGLKMLQLPKFLAGLLGFGETGSEYVRELQDSMANVCNVPVEFLYPERLAITTNSAVHLLPKSNDTSKNISYREVYRNWIKGVLDDTTKNPLATLIDGFTTDRHRYKDILLHRNSDIVLTDQERFDRAEFDTNFKIAILSYKSVNYRAFIRTPGREMELSAMRFIFDDDDSSGTGMTAFRIFNMFKLGWTATYYKRYSSLFYSFESYMAPGERYIRRLQNIANQISGGEFRFSRSSEFLPSQPSLLPEGYPHTTGRTPTITAAHNINMRDLYPSVLYGPGESPGIIGADFCNEDDITRRYDRSVPVQAWDLLREVPTQRFDLPYRNIRRLVGAYNDMEGTGNRIWNNNTNPEEIRIPSPGDITGEFRRLGHFDDDGNAIMDGAFVCDPAFVADPEREIVGRSIRNAIATGFTGEIEHPAEDPSIENSPIIVRGSIRNTITGFAEEIGYPVEDPDISNSSIARGASSSIIFDEDVSAEDYVNDNSYDPDEFIFHSTSIGYSSLFIGVELEIDDGGKYNLDALRHVHSLNHFSPKGFVYKSGENTRHVNEDDELVYVKSDASLNNGFEIVMHPCTLDYHKQIGYEDLFKYLQDAGYKSHDTSTCGLHVHINRDYFGSKKIEQDLKICNFLYLIESNWVKCTRIARRRSNRYSVRLTYGGNDSPLDLYAQSIREGKYACVNLQHEDTVEIRMFKGTLNYDTFISTLEFVKILATIAKNTEIIDIYKITWDDIKKGFSERLSEYFNRRSEKELELTGKEVLNPGGNQHSENSLLRGLLEDSNALHQMTYHSDFDGDLLQSFPSMIRGIPRQSRHSYTDRIDAMMYSMRDNGQTIGRIILDSLPNLGDTESDSRELTEEERITRDINDLRARSRRRGINYMEAQSINRKIAKLERELRAVRNNRNTQNFQYTPDQGFQYQSPVEQPEQISETGSMILDSVIPGALARIPILSNYPSFEDRPVRIYPYQYRPRILSENEVDALLEEQDNQSVQQQLPAIHAFERWQVSEYEPVQNRIVIRNRNPISDSHNQDLISTINSTCSGADMGENPLVAYLPNNETIPDEIGITNSMTITRGSESWEL